MGFDLFIQISLPVNPTTGAPSVWLANGTYGPFVPDDYTVPEMFRQFLWQRGPHWHKYIERFDDSFDCTAGEFLHNYPEWSDLEGWDWWTEADHDSFKAALSWFSEKGCFRLSWSY